MTTEKIMIKHYFNSIHPYGGITYCYKVIDNILYVGIAYCSPKDIYSRKVGRKVAETNLNNLIESGEECTVKARFITGFKTNVADVIKNHLETISYDDRFNEAISFVLNKNSFNDEKYHNLIINYSDCFSEMINEYHFYKVEQKLINDGQIINSCMKYYYCE